MSDIRYMVKIERVENREVFVILGYAFTQAEVLHLYGNYQKCAETYSYDELKACFPLPLKNAVRCMVEIGTEKTLNWFHVERM